MNCKSCSSEIKENNRFCSNCGSKIVNDRLSLKGTWEEFVGPFFSWDNNFWRTFFDLFTNPKDVLEAYISGARKKYFQPFSFIILYATIAVFFYKFFPLDIIVDYSKDFTDSLNTSNPSAKLPKFDMKNYMESIMSYYNFLVLLLIPVYALTSLIIYNKRGHNFFEHLVFNSYIQTNLGFIALVIQIILVNIIGMSFMSYSVLFMFIHVFFTTYVFKKLYDQSVKQSILSGIKYFLLFLILYVGVFLISSIIFGIIMLITLL